MSNTILTPTQVTRKALMVLHQKLTFVGSINRQYDDSFAKSGAKIGDSLKIRLPNQYTVTNGSTLTAQDTTEESVTLQVSTQKHVGMNFTSADLTLSLDDFSERIIDPAMAVLAAAVEADALSMRLNVWQQANNTGAAITFANVLQGRKLLVDSLTPPGSRTALLNSNDSVSLVDALKGLNQDDKSIAKQYREGHMATAAGFSFEESTHLSTQTRGDGASYQVDTRTSAMPLVATPITSITTLTGTGTMNVGEIFTIGNVFKVHPETKANTGILQQFVVTATVAAAGATSISPSIILAGAKQNVIIPTTSATATITIAGTASTNYGQSLVYHKDAFAFATADLVMPKGVDFAAREVYDGISLRIVRNFDIINDKFPCRVDILYGYKAVRPQLAARLANLAPAA